MKTSLTMLTVGLWALGASAAVTEYFVDATAGNDAYDGTSSNYVSGVIGPKKTIQAAVDLTKDDDVVTVLPGVYDTGSRLYGDSEFRVVITNRIVLRSAAGKEVTHIVGKKADTSTGYGTGAVRGVAMEAQMYNILEGFTIRDCACSDDASSGAAVYMRWNSYVVDCTIRNCAACQGAVAYKGIFLRCLITENTATKQAICCDQAYFQNCVICRNQSGNYLFNYVKEICNCTIVENRPAIGLFSEGKHDIHNSIFLDNYGRNGNVSYSTAYAIVTGVASSQFKAYDEQCVFEASRFQLQAPALNDWRPLATSSAIGRGDSTYLTTISLYHPTKVWSDYLLAHGRYVDYLGASIAESGSINCGAVQATATPGAGRITIGTELRYSPTVSFHCQEDGQMCDYSYAHAADSLSVLKVKAEFASGTSVYAFTNSVTPFSLQIYHFPGLDGYLPVGYPVAGSEITVVPRSASAELYVDCANGKDTNNGSATNLAFKTLQAAVDAASSSDSKFTLVHVAPGVYDEGGAPVASSDLGSNRVMITKSVSLVATEGPSKTFIVGAPDPETGTYGPNAVRCIYQKSSSRGSSVRGFTLTGGYTRFDSSSATAATAENGGAVYGSHDCIQDCIISNNYARGDILETGLYVRCKVLNNTSAESHLCTSADFISSVVAHNTYPSSKKVMTYSHAYASTIEGAFNWSDYAIGCIVYNGGSATLEQSTISEGNVLWNTVWAGKVANNVTGNPRFVKASAGDWRVRENSIVLGAAQVNDENALLRIAPLDVDGNVPYVKNGHLSSGACQSPVAVPALMLIFN